MPISLTIHATFAPRRLSVVAQSVNVFVGLSTCTSTGAASFLNRSA